MGRRQASWSSMNVVRNLKTVFKSPIQSSSLLYRISVKFSSYPALNTSRDRVLSTFWHALFTFVTVFFISIWNLFLDGLNSVVPIVLLGAQIQTSVHMAVHSSKLLHYLQPLLTWFGSEDPHVLIVPLDSVLQVWDEQSRLNWILRYFSSTQGT